MSTLDSKGTIFNIQHYSIHDGPGIRTSVFMKGCPLSCLWCQNPESNSVRPQLMYNRDTCTGCLGCMGTCPQNAIRQDLDKVITDRALCTGCGACAEVCPSRSRTIMGKTMTSDEVYQEAAKDTLFYRNSGGGVTLTGGEVLFHPLFARDILRKCRENNIHTAIETCGYADWRAFSEILPYVDLVIYDIKHMDSAMHRKGTGVGNERILENLARISGEMSIPIIARTPIIPGYNDTEENAHLMAAFLRDNVKTCKEVDLLPYHSLGVGKKSQLEEDSVFISHAPGEGEMEHLRTIIRSYGIEVY